jgi:hypothetical protein
MLILFSINLTRGGFFIEVAQLSAVSTVAFQSKPPLEMHL